MNGIDSAGELSGVRSKIGDMRRFRRIPLIAWTIFLAASIPGLGGFGGIVLCFGANGHIAFETASPGGVCLSSSGRATPPLADPDRSRFASSRQDHCDPCVDFPVLVNDIGNSGSPLVFQKTNPVPHAGGTPAAFDGASVPGMRTALLQSGIRLDLPDPTSISLRNTVLLI
jgi:hypothetical protein